MNRLAYRLQAVSFDSRGHTHMMVFESSKDGKAKAMKLLGKWYRTLNISKADYWELRALIFGVSL